MLQRHPSNPILTRKSIPDVPPHLVDVSSVYNPGAVFWQGKHYLILRTQARSRETFFMVAESDDGVDFKVQPRAIQFANIPEHPKAFHYYDPRLTILNGRCYIMFAVDFEDFCSLGLAVTDDFENFEFLGYTKGTNLDTRNGVLFPEKISGKYCCLERPNIAQEIGNPTSGDTITLSTSDDLIHWEHKANIISGRWRYWDERIGAGPPPIKTRQGWLVIYHGVATHFSSSNIYQAGVMLLDLDDPSKVISRSRHNILEPREDYETIGQVANVVFPSGAIVSDHDADGFALPDAEVKIYYGAADTSIGLATATIAELITASQAPSGHPGS